MISTVRKKLSAEGAQGVIETRGEGYLACPDMVIVNVAGFEEAVRGGIGWCRGAVRGCVGGLRAGVGRLAGPALAGLPGRILDAEAARLADPHALAVEDFAAARLALGHDRCRPQRGFPSRWPDL